MALLVSLSSRPPASAQSDLSILGLEKCSRRCPTAPWVFPSSGPLVSHLSISSTSK